jgi:TetR/AcrR family transcriptional regulator, repressor of the mexAB-oprM multidrug resistance operon
MKQSKAETERTRVALMDAAELLFWQHGVARTSVLEIATTAGLTRGAFYHHFADKASVLEALIARTRLPREHALPTPPDGADALATLRAHCHRLFELFVADRSCQRTFAIVMHRRESLGDLEPLAAARRVECCRSAATYERLLQRADEAGRLAPSWTPSIAATTLFSAQMGLFDQWLRDPDRFEIRPVGLAVIDQLLDSFERRPARQTRRR